MKKKFMLTALSSVLALGFLGACGDVENEPLNDGNNGFENNGLNDDGMDNDNGDM